MRKKIVLVGAGQLGSRHLQALALLEEAVEIMVVDPNLNSLKIAKERFESVASYKRHQCEYISSLSEISSERIDLGIISTGSAIRSIVITELLNGYKCDYLLLEKVLFQKLVDYVAIGQLLSEKGTKTYVNCPRRMFETYRNIRLEIDRNEPLHLEVVGSNWGMGCNGIHFIDLFHFLTGQAAIAWQNHLDDEVRDSKRAGYKEFFGRLVGQSEGGSTISLTCFYKGIPNISVRITTPSRRYVIAEGLNQVWEESFDDAWKVKESPFQMEYQSKLTHSAVEALFATGECALTPFGVSKILHTSFIEVLLAHYNKKHRTDICPIT